MFSWGKVPYPAFNNEQGKKITGNSLPIKIVVEKVSAGYRMNPPQNMDPEIVKLMGKCWEQK
jgi:hypothetical protein